MSDEGERLLAIFDTNADGLKYRCPCDFHQGRWDISTATTDAGVPLTGNGCLASGANPPALTGHANLVPPPGIGIWGYMRSEEKEADALGRIARIKAYTTPKTGFNCIRCNFKNDYACANQSDGTYVCFNCR